MRVLVVSKNILSDIGIQEDLQKFDYEVMISPSVYEYLSYHIPVTELLNYFSVLVISENFTDEEVKQMLPILVEENRSIIRRSYQAISEEEKEAWKDLGVAHWHSLSDPLIMLKQAVEELANELEPVTDFSGDYNTNNVQANNRISLFHTVSFTPTEINLIQLLVEAKGNLVTKEAICQGLWNQGVTNSKKVQIYTLIGRIKEKLSAVSSYGILIGSQRGNGYYLTNSFFEQFIVDSSWMCPQTEAVSL